MECIFQLDWFGFLGKGDSFTFGWIELIAGMIVGLVLHSAPAALVCESVNIFLALITKVIQYNKHLCWLCL